MRVASKINGEYFIEYNNSIQDVFSNLKINEKNQLILVDRNIYDLYRLKEYNFIRIIIIDAFESNKNIEYSVYLIKCLLELKVRRNDVLVSVGGGITQDLVAFISTIIFRGLKWNYIPTTLLSQCDSCIGSKSSINFENYKNLLGTFYPPSKIVVCSDFLKSLPVTEIKSGIGEMYHYFVTKNFNHVIELNSSYESYISDPTLLSKYIQLSLSIKREIIEIDEFDVSIRHIFNYGHTFGHAIETLTAYAIPHGQAVTIGMDIANYISFKLKFIDESQFKLLHECFLNNFPKYSFDALNLDLYFDILSKDKKNIGTKLGCILFNGTYVEKVFIDFDHILKSILNEYFNKFLS